MNIRTRKEIDNSILFTPEARKRKEEIVYEILKSFPKLRKYKENCPDWEKRIGLGLMPECDVCNKFLCFLDCVMFNELKMKKKLNYKKMINDGIVENMIFGTGIKLLE